jgi:gamma-glutamyl-gamma-aminobutyrate hydrolase PuuD
MSSDIILNLQWHPENMKRQKSDLILEFTVLKGTIRKGESEFH